MASLRPPLLLIQKPPGPLDVHVQIPRPNDNLFERLIRDPQAPHRPARERKCAEMLRTVLVICPDLARYVFKWLAQYAPVPGSLIDELDWSLETEQAIGSKRDDLRIEGCQMTDGVSDHAVLWTIEVKVAASLHESSCQDFGENPGEAAQNDPEIVSQLVNQLVNYDEWLDCQVVPHKAGFVLSLRNLSDVLPDGLKQPWHCITWTDLALAIEAILVENELPIAERPFAEHMLGFIRHRLWDTTDMGTAQLELDDVALLRALTAIGPSCSRKLKLMVDQFQDLFEATEVDFHSLKSTSSFFDRTDVAQYSSVAHCVSDSSWVFVTAGVYGDTVRVWVSCNPNVKETRQAVRKLMSDAKPSLLERNSDWIIVEADDSDWVDAEISKPLVSVLGEEDWQSPLINFVREALEDLKVTGVLDSLVSLESNQEEL